MIKRLVYGIVVWAIPYITSIPLLPLMRSDPTFFKTIMIVEGSLVGAILAAAYFVHAERDYLREGVTLGVVWMVENWLLDFAAVLPFTHMTVTRYFIEIGLRYLVMVMLTAAIGYVLAKRVPVAA